MTQLIRAAIFCVAFFASAATSANDSTARVGAGGLVLGKTDDIQMVSEVVEISTTKIRVTYHFFNTSDRDIETTVAFPMPGFNGLGDSSENARPLDSFQSFVNGVSVSVNKSRVFQVDNIDVTERLRKIGLSDTQIFDPEFPCMWGNADDAESSGCKLTARQNEAIKNLNAYKGQIKETAYWEQTFPAGRETVVMHEYKPFVGSHPQLDKKAIQEACLDNRTIRATGGEFNEFGYLQAGARDVEYILGTGRNWKGPIKKFTLIIKKDSPGQIVSFCIPGKPVKTNSSTFEYSRTDFVPPDRLIIYFFGN